MVLGISGKRSVQIVLVLTAISLWLIFMRDLNPHTLDLNLGIEFIGGVRIPVSLDKPVDTVTMSSIVDTLKARINKYGMAQFVVRPLGDREVIVEIPKASPEAIKSVEAILKEQGKFEAIVGGKLALVGEEIMPGAVGGAQGERIIPSQEGMKWELDFAVSRRGGEKFAKAAYGKANYPVYMFLDRPDNAAIVLRRTELNLTNVFLANKVLEEALKKEGADITLIYVEDWASEKAKLLNASAVIVGASLRKFHPKIIEEIYAFGFGNATLGNASKKFVVKPDEEVVPKFYQTGVELSIVEWRAIGLLSAPTLSPGLATGHVSQFYSVSGSAKGETSQEQHDYAVAEIRKLKSILSGGRLPVSTSIGSAYTIAPPLGEKFLFYSGVGCVIAIVVVSGIIIVRYRKPVLALPLIGINVIEIIILTAVVGAVTGTLELSAMAGIIALIGAAVDDQIIVIEEMLRKRTAYITGESAERRETKERLSRAFYIVLTTASISFLSMFPLLLSGIIEITGFALATMLEVAIGAVITRPAYGEIIESMARKGMI